MSAADSGENNNVVLRRCLFEYPEDALCRKIGYQSPLNLSALSVVYLTVFWICLCRGTPGSA
jgi:hypothetical protein